MRPADDPLREIPFPGEVFLEVPDTMFYVRLGQSLVVEQVDGEHLFGKLPLLSDAPLPARKNAVPGRSQPDGQEHNT